MSAGPPPPAWAPSPEPTPNADEGAQPGKSQLRAYGEVIGIAVALALLLRMFFIEAFTMPEDTATLIYDTAANDHCFVLKPAYLFSPPARGDLILLSRSGLDLVSRVVGLPGERIEVSPAGLRINGQLKSERHLLLQRLTPYSVVVPDKHVFVLPDNRAVARGAGSSYWGAIPYDEIKGKYTFRWWPWARIGWIKAPEEM